MSILVMSADNCQYMYILKISAHDKYFRWIIVDDCQGKKWTISWYMIWRHQRLALSQDSSEPVFSTSTSNKQGTAIYTFNAHSAHCL